MRYALDTNLAVSALFKLQTPPAIVLAAWLMRRFEWVTCETQIIELRVTLRQPKTIARSLGGADAVEALLFHVESRCLARTLTAPLSKVTKRAGTRFRPARTLSAGGSLTFAPPWDRMRPFR